MTLTVTDVAEFVRHRLDGEPSLSPVPLCNQAGRHLVSMHEWEWLVRPPRPISFSSGSSKVRLPDDFGREIASQGVGVVTGRLFHFVSAGELASIAGRFGTAVGPWRYYATLVFEPDVVTGVLSPYAYITPTPTASESGTVNLWYRAKWSTLTNDDDVLPIPENAIESLFLEIAGAVALAREEHDLGLLSQRLEAIKQSSMYMDAVAEDGLRTSSPTEMQGGMWSGWDIDWSLYPYSITGP